MRTWIGIALGIVVTLLACLMIAGLTVQARPQLQVASPTPARPTATPLPGAIGPEQYSPQINPLTGLAVSDPVVLDRRPLAIKISNAPASVRPQAGLSQADLVFEHYVEGRLTRFTAIFYSQTPEYVGSVRSARLIDLQIPIMYQSLFAYSGASGLILERIGDSPFAARAFHNVGQPLFYRNPDIEIPHNLFVVPSAVWQRATNRGLHQRPGLQGMTFYEHVPPGAVSAARTIWVDYGPVVAQWQYDDGQGVYERAVNGEQHIDALNGATISTANVVMIWTHHQEDVTIVENEWEGNFTYSLEMQIWTLGPATLFRDGLRYDGYWHRWQDELMLTFWADDSMTERLYLKPGVTWFQVVPLDFTGLMVSAG